MFFITFISCFMLHNMRVLVVGEQFFIISKMNKTSCFKSRHFNNIYIYFQHSKIKFVSPRGHVISSISNYCAQKKPLICRNSITARRNVSCETRLVVSQGALHCWLDPKPQNTTVRINTLGWKLTTAEWICERARVFRLKNPHELFSNWRCFCFVCGANWAHCLRNAVQCILILCIWNWARDELEQAKLVESLCKF